MKILIDKCYLELDTLYLGSDIGDITREISLSECCNACSINKKCRSWVYNLVNQTCTIKNTFRGGYYSLSGFVSGFVKPQCKLKYILCCTKYFVN
jgi:hypothetical protein